MSFIASAVFCNSLEGASAMVRLTTEKSLSDWAELAEMQRMRLATLANTGNSLPFSFQNSSRVVFSRESHRLYLASSSLPDARLWFVGSWSFVGLPAFVSSNGSLRAFFAGKGQTKPLKTLWRALYNSKILYKWSAVLVVSLTNDKTRQDKFYFTNIYQCSALWQWIIFDRTRPNPTQPMGQPNKCPCLL